MGGNVRMGPGCVRPWPMQALGGVFAPTPPVPPGVVTFQHGLVTGEAFVGPSSTVEIV